MAYKKFLIPALLTLCILSAAAGCITSPLPQETNETITILQTNGEPLTLPHTVERIVVLNSNAAELLFTIGAGDKIVGVSQAALNHPERKLLFPNAVSVGQSTVPDTEAVFALHPDLIIAFNSMKPKNADILENSGIPIAYIDCYKPTVMCRDVTSLGMITGNTREADAYLTYVEGIISTVEQRVRTIPESSWPVVYGEFSSDYSIQGNDTSIDILLGIAGGKNIVTEPLVSSSPKVSNEWIVTKDPDIIIKLITTDTLSEIESTYRNLISRTGFATLHAVRDNRTYIMRNDLTYGPRSFAGAVLMAKTLHPDKFEDMDVHSILDQYNTRFNLNFSHDILIYPAS